MIKARLINRSSVEVIDWDKEETRIRESFEMEKMLAGESVKDKDTYSKIMAAHKKNFEWLCQFEPFIPCPSPELEALEAVNPVYEFINGAIVQKWESTGADMHRVASRIKDLKQQLAGSDYLIIKYQETMITGGDPGRGILDTIKERQQWRDEINKLHAFIKS